MSELLSVVASGMAFDTERLQSISHNLANVSTTAYKRSSLSRSPITSTFDHQMQLLSTGEYEETQAIDLRIGPMKQTGNSLDLAIEGPGFFEVKSPLGLVYTRAGNFQLDQLGKLVTAAGYPVMGTSGEITMLSSQPVIDKTGQIFEKDKRIGELRLVTFDDTSQLTYLGEGLYRSSGAEVAAEPGTNRLRQGSVEASNVLSMYEMVGLIETMRHFESMQKVVQGWDSSQDTVIRKLGEF